MLKRDKGRSAKVVIFRRPCQEMDEKLRSPFVAWERGN